MGAPVKGQYFENITPVTGKAFCEVARGTAEDIELALDAAHKAAPSWGKTSVAERAAILNKIADRIEAEPRDARRRRNLGQRQADPRNPQRRHPARRRPLPLLCLRRPRPGGPAVPARRRHHRLPLPRAARRRRPDHSLELPDPDGRLEARPGARRRQRRRPEAGRADPVLDPGPDGTHRRPAAGRRRQRGQRLRRRSRQAARLQPPDPQDRVHRRNLHRPADQPVREPEPDPGHAGTGRQEPNIFFNDVAEHRRRLLRQGTGRLHALRLQPG